MTEYHETCTCWPVLTWEQPDFKVTVLLKSSFIMDGMWHIGCRFYKDYPNYILHWKLDKWVRILFTFQIWWQERCLDWLDSHLSSRWSYTPALWSSRTVKCALADVCSTRRLSSEECMWHNVIQGCIDDSALSQEPDCSIDSKGLISGFTWIYHQETFP